MARPTKPDRVLGPYPDRGEWRLVLVAGKGARSSERFKTEKQALKAKELYERELKITTGKTFADAKAEYGRHLVQKGNGARTIETTLYRLECMFGHVELPLAMLGDDEGGELYARLHTVENAKGAPVYKPASHRAILSESKTFVRWCVAKKYARANFLDAVQGVGKKNSGRYKIQLRLDEATKLAELSYELAGRSDEGALAVLFALMHDLRAGEIVGLHPRDIDGDGTILHVEDAKTPSGNRSLKIAPRLVPILRRVVKRQIEQKLPFVIGTAEEPQRDRNWVHRQVDKLCARAGVPIVGPHGLRRTHSTLTYEAGATAEMLERAMGHTSFEAVTRKSYIKHGTVEKVRAQKVIDLLDFKERHSAQRADEPDAVEADDTDTGQPR